MVSRATPKGRGEADPKAFAAGGTSDISERDQHTYIYIYILDRSSERFRPLEVIPNGSGSHRNAEQQTFLCKVLESELALNKFGGVRR